MSSGGGERCSKLRFGKMEEEGDIMILGRKSFVRETF